MKNVRLLSILAAAGGAVSTVIAIALGIRDTGDALDSGGAVFIVMMVALGALPYAVTFFMSRSYRPYVRLWGAWALGLYGIGDIVIRGQILVFPQSSTDAVALFTYPLVGTAVMFSIAALAAKITART